MGNGRVRKSGVRAGRAWLKALVGLVVIAGLGGVGYALLAEAPGESRGLGGADLATVSRMDFEITVVSTGDLRAKNQLEIRSELESSSTIAEVIEEGTTVKEGDLLVRLNADDLVAEVEEEQLRVESARSELIAAENAYEIQLSENDSRLRKAKLDLELAQLALQQFKLGDAEKSATDLRQKIDSAERNLARLEKKHDQNVDLADKGFISLDDLERGLIDLEEARATLKIAQLNLEIFEKYQYPRDLETKQADVNEAQAELQRVERENEIQLASKEAARVNARRQLQIREQRLAKDEHQVEAATIYAPKAGLVVYGTSTRSSWREEQTPLQIGRQVYPNELLIILPDTTEMIAEVSVPESMAGRVQPGQAARVKVDALGGETFPGHVVSKGVLAESGGWRDPNTREYTVRIALNGEGSNGRLKPSMRCEAEIQLGMVDDVMAVPIQAVFREGPVQFVYTPRGGKMARVPISVGRRSDAYAEVTTGLNPGTLVLVREPRPAEVLREDWDPSQLKLVGLELGEDGQPRRIGMPGGPGAMPGRPGAMPGARPDGDGGGGRPAGRGEAVGRGDAGGQPGAEGGDDASNKRASGEVASNEDAAGEAGAEATGEEAVADANGDAEAGAADRTEPGSE